MTTIEAVSDEIAARFWRKVDLRGADDCWPWLRAKHKGYGTFSVGEAMWKAHRWVYHAVVGDIPPGMTVDHRCHNEAKAAGLCAGGETCPHRACVNPAHLEPVTTRLNTQRAHPPLTHCPADHPYDEENTYVDPRGRRQCRTCRRQRDSQREC